MADVFGNDSAVDPRMDDVLHPADVTILGVGNVIQHGGLAAAGGGAHQQRTAPVVDGGTLGIELTQYVTGTKKLLVIDSINGGQEPGTRFHFHNDDIMAHFQDKLSAHEVGIQDVLALLTVTGRKIPEVVVLGAQPYDLEAGVELSLEMKALLPLVAQEAIDVLKEWGIEVKEKAEERSLDYGVVAEECVREEMK